jgi:hypothetical protein
MYKKAEENGLFFIFFVLNLENCVNVCICTSITSKVVVAVAAS